MCCILLKIVKQCFIWRSEYIVDFMYLVYFIISGEQRKQRNNLKENTAHTPEIHFVTIVAVSQKTLRRPIPPRRNILSVWLLGVNSSAGPKVSKFDVVFRKENVLRLDVSVEDAVSVHVVNRFDKLVHVVLHSVLRQVVPFAFDSVVHVHIHQLENQGQSAGWFVVENLVKLYYLGMRT